MGDRSHGASGGSPQYLLATALQAERECFLDRRDPSRCRRQRWVGHDDWDAWDSRGRIRTQPEPSVLTPGRDLGPWGHVVARTFLWLTLTGSRCPGGLGRGKLLRCGEVRRRAG